MIREREEPNESGFRPGQEVFDTPGSEPHVESVFNSSQAAPVRDDGRHKPLVVVDEGADMVGQVEAERGGNVSGKGRKRITGAILLLLVLGTGVIAFLFISGSGGTKKGRVPVNKTNANSQTEDAATKQAIEELNGASPGVTLSDGSQIRPQASPVVSPSVPNSTSTQPVTELPQSGNLTATVGPLSQTSKDGAADNASGSGSAL